MRAMDVATHTCFQMTLIRTHLRKDRKQRKRAPQFINVGLRLRQPELLETGDRYCIEIGLGETR